jgi:mannan endo-1,4-beta-mannosidase
MKRCLIVGLLGLGSAGVILLSLWAAGVLEAASPGVWPWTGNNHYYLHTCSERRQEEVLSFMAERKMLMLRVYLLSTENEGYSGDPECDQVPDIENPVGQWNPAMLVRLGHLLKRAEWYGIKIFLTVHDRWSLGCWRYDAYAVANALPRGQPQPQNGERACIDNNVAMFYSNASTRAAFKRRLRYVMSYVHPIFNRSLGTLKSIAMVEPQNEPQRGYVTPYDDSWLCEMARELKQWTIPVASGGGWESYYLPGFDPIASMASCPYLDWITPHVYLPSLKFRLSIEGLYGQLKGQKPMLVSEWSADSKEEFDKKLQVFRDLRLPWMYWSFGPFDPNWLWKGACCPF